MKMKHSRWLFTAVAALLFIAGASHADAPAGRYQTPASGTVYDTKTKLTWQQAVPQTGSYTWGSASTSGTAQNYCATLVLNGTGWRVPTVGELVTLVDYTQAGGSSAMIDPTFFPNTPASAYWSATPTAGSPTLAWYVYFVSGYSYVVDVSGAGYVRCVR